MITTLGTVYLAVRSTSSDAEVAVRVPLLGPLLVDVFLIYVVGAQMGVLPTL